LQERLLYLLDNDRVRAEFSRHAREDILANASIEGMYSGFKSCVDYLMSRQRMTEGQLAGRNLRSAAAK